MEANVEIDMASWRRMLADISDSKSRVENLLRAVFNTVGFKDINDHFRNEQGETKRWKRRAASTQTRYANIMSGKWSPPKGMQRAAFNPSNKVLQLTGALRQSIVPANIKSVTKNSIMIFSNLEYSGRHDQGTDGMPQRQFMWVSDGAMNRMAQIAVELWLRGSV